MSNEFYFMFIHPSTAKSLEFTPKERWKLQQRGARLLKRHGVVPAQTLPVVETGYYGGIRIIQS